MTRADMDAFALRSHRLAIQATDEGRLPEEIVPVTVKSRKSEDVVEIDEAPRRDATLEKLASLTGAFNPDGTHTAGNSPGVNDGAGALVLVLRRVGEGQRPQVLATILGAGRRRRRLRRTSRAPRPTRRSSRSTGSASTRRTSTCGRSTRRSRPSR